MIIYSYIITRDFGFAPNPFPPACTLAACKPRIRKRANIKDWVVGIGSSEKNSTFKNKLIYTMQVSEKLSYNEYWADHRFMRKRPVMNVSKKQMYGDNIYHRNNCGEHFIQENSHHSLPDGGVNLLNYKRDLSGEFVLVSYNYWYFGKDALNVPRYLDFLTKVTRNYIKIEDEHKVKRFVQWISSLSGSGYIGEPCLFNKSFIRHDGKD